jgi:hypothetical protein
MICFETPWRYYIRKTLEKYTLLEQVANLQAHSFTLDRRIGNSNKNHRVEILGFLFPEHKSWQESIKRMLNVLFGPVKFKIQLKINHNTNHD